MVHRRPVFRPPVAFPKCWKFIEKDRTKPPLGHTVPIFFWPRKVDSSTSNLKPAAADSLTSYRDMRPSKLQKLSCTLAATATLGAPAFADSWEDKAIAPVTNPVFFETPLIQSEVRPIFAAHRTDASFLGVEADVRLYAAQIRWAVNDRLAIIAVKDGYIQFKPEGASTTEGWADLAAGLKYAVIKDDAKQLIVTPGVTVEVPTGDEKVFQGNGGGQANLFVSAMKGWDNLHVTANVGGTVPFDSDLETSKLHYSAMVDYYTCQYFIPFVAANAFTTISDAQGPAFNSEGFDLINFGSSNASGRTQVAIGAGFRSRLTKSLDIGFAYEYGVSPDNDIFKDRFTVDLIWRFL